MGIFELFHAILDRILAPLRLVQNSEYGWKSLDRKTGRLMHEQQPLMKKLKLIFLFNPLMEWIDNTHRMRLHIHDKSLKEGTRMLREHGQLTVSSLLHLP